VLNYPSTVFYTVMQIDDPETPGKEALVVYTLP